ncbi:MAG: glycosyltransferase family 39 protein [Bacteroidales bacterium]|jgi:4-amino-4-deoxy-L-arabinose transferase|nr:glycosyltransferase family 39 protein [Bacteroidales bacterium]
MIDFFDISGFALHQYAWLALGGVLFCVSLFFHLKEKNRFALFFLLCTALSLFIFAALLDPYLNLWDERIHALVAKNSMDNLLKPEFFQHPYVTECNYLNWTSAHIWLHKQPLFIWQMALSMKLFGVNEFAVRLPSVLMAAGSVLIGYRIGKLLINEKVAYYTAISITFSWFLLNLVSGYEGIEHNDVCFFFYVSASLWSFIEYIQSNRKWKWVIWIGFFAGCAVLTKWLTGLLVFFTWGVYILATYGFKIKQWKWTHILTAVVICSIIFIPWQIYIITHYYDAALFEYQYNSKHLFEQIEGQNTHFFFHFEKIPYLYLGHKQLTPEGTTSLRTLVIILNAVILIFGLSRLVFFIKKRNIRITILSTLLFIYLFFSFATTKMPAYTLIIGMIWFISLGMFIDFIMQCISLWVRKKSIKMMIQTFFLLLFSFYMLNFTRIRNQHTDDTIWRQDMITNKATFLRIKEQLPPNAIVFNLRGSGIYGHNGQYIEASFYIDRDVYPLPPKKETIQTLKSKGFIPVYISKHPLPDYILNDPDAIFIDEEILNDL